jgi:hypothetical protein
MVPTQSTDTSAALLLLPPTEDMGTAVHFSTAADSYQLACIFTQTSEHRFDHIYHIFRVKVQHSSP